MTTRPSLVLRIGDRPCCLDARLVSEVLRPRPLAPFDAAGPAVLGAAIIRGEPTPVIDAAAALGLPPSAEPAARWVVARPGRRPLALAVAAVIGVRPMDLDQDSAWTLDADASVGFLAWNSDVLLLLRSLRIFEAACP